MNPSCNLDSEFADNGFPNLGDPPFDRERSAIIALESKEAGLDGQTDVERVVDDRVCGQAASCGISVQDEKPTKTAIVRYTTTYHHHGWNFQRRWYYWSGKATSNRFCIPQDVANRINGEHGREIRVNGCAGGEAVDGPVSSYHIDTVRGLKTVADALSTTFFLEL